VSNAVAGLRDVPLEDLYTDTSKIDGGDEVVSGIASVTSDGLKLARCHCDLT
jgi:hypothetical protein